MKALKYLGTAALATYALFVLAACNGTSNGSNSTASCTLNASTGMYVDQNGNACAGTSSTTMTCPANGLNPYNQQVCTPGTIITTGTTGIPGGPANYPYSQTQTAYGSGCSSYLYTYGMQYVPIYYNGQLMCANYTYLIQSMSSQYYSSYQSTPYYNNPSYWYSYPPYGGSNYYGSGSAYFGGGYAQSISGGSGFSLNIGIGASFNF